MKKTSIYLFNCLFYFIEETAEFENASDLAEHDEN